MDGSDGGQQVGNDGGQQQVMTCRRWAAGYWHSAITVGSRLAVMATEH